MPHQVARVDGALTAVRALRVFTIGHSTRPLDEFLRLLTAFGITLLADIRIAPSSRRYPHFARDALSRALAEAGIGYFHLADLGGHRRPRSDSPHAGWRSAGFRGYADHMESEAFRRAIDGLMAQMDEETIALMCAEAVPWRCHRQLVADALMARGVEVIHILGPGKSQAHTMTSFARREGARVVYDVVDAVMPSTPRAREAGASPETPAPGRRKSGGRRGRSG